MLSVWSSLSGAALKESDEMKCLGHHIVMLEMYPLNVMVCGLTHIQVDCGIFREKAACSDLVHGGPGGSVWGR